MATIEFEGARLPVEEGETVLDVLLRAGHLISHRCRSGICRSCAMVAVGSEPGEAAQVGLADVERRRGVFLTCQLRPRGDMVVRSLDDRDAIEAEIVELERRGSVVLARLRPSSPLTYEAGQFVILQRADMLARSYSLASLPSEPLLELHVRRVPGGRMSGWLFDEASVGTHVALRGPYGTCCYPSDELDAPLLLVGVGTGMAPLWGVLRQALAHGHRGPITIVEAAPSPRDLYLHAPLRELAAAHGLQIRCSVLREAEGEFEQREVDALALACLRESGRPAKAFLAYVCGDATIVQRIRKGLFMAGVSSRRIFVDPFE
jgi:NAD(P)H-flavin reductase